MGDISIPLKIEIGDDKNKIIYNLDQDEAREFLQKLRRRDYSTEYEKTKAIAEIVGDIKDTKINLPEKQPEEKIEEEVKGFSKSLKGNLTVGFLIIGIVQLALEGDGTALGVFAGICVLEFLKLIYNIKYDNGIREKLRNMRKNNRNK